MRLLIVDTETGGRDPQRHALLEVAALVVDGELQELGRFHSLVIPWPGLVIEPESLKLTGVDLQEVGRQGLAEGEALRRLLAFAAEYADGDGMPTLSGWNVAFDEGFLRAAAARHGLEWPFSHKLLDIQSVWAFRQRWDFRGLTSAAMTLWGRAPSHRALPDALLALDILRASFGGG